MYVPRLSSMLCGGQRVVQRLSARVRCASTADSRVDDSASAAPAPTTASDDPVAHLLPSETVCKAAKDKQLLDLICKELEIYAYMSRIVPKGLSDEHWAQLLKCNSVSERVGFLNFIAVKERREERDVEKKKHKEDHFKKILDEEAKKFERGEMAYGPGMCQLIANPFRNQRKINHISGARIASAIRVEKPVIALDMQHIFSGKNNFKNKKEMGKQVQYSISENFASRSPFDLSLVNMPKTTEAKDYVLNTVGFYGGVHTKQIILPDIHNKMPYPKKEMVYISRYAHRVLDEPLNKAVYVLPVSMDFNRESIGAARRANIQAVRLPIQKYVKWESGPMYLPLPNILRIFREVHESGGDWETALRNNISKRHLMPAEERNENVVNKRKEVLQDRKDLIAAICEGTGQATPVFKF